MPTIRVACQTYTWEMQGDRWRGKVTDILDWIAAAGYAGIEITCNMIGEFAKRPDDFIAELQDRSLALACFAYSSPSGFTESGSRSADLEGALEAIEFVRQFPEPRLGLGGAASFSREHARAKLDVAISLYSEIGRAARAAGVSANVHPHSHHGSLLETAEEYDYLLSQLDPDCVSFGPDTGHIVRGGQDLMGCLSGQLDRITHLHLKDADANRDWRPLGEGLCDFPGVLALLQSSGYAGWLVAEEESAEAAADGVGAIRRNREYLRGLGC
jgi:sugar phosphate isomerase/epimerase